MHRWLIQTTGKKEKPSLETKQGERIEGTQLKQQINVLECWRGKKKCPGFDTAQSSLPRYFQACKLTRFFLGGLACIIHTGGPPDGQQMLLHRQPSTYFYICLVCVWCACVCDCGHAHGMVHVWNSWPLSILFEEPLFSLLQTPD